MATPLIDVKEEFGEGIDPFYVGNKSDDFYYLWANKKPENLQRRKIEGYEVVTGKVGENALVEPNAVGERVMGDVILMRMPRERHEKLVKRHFEKSRAQLDSANDNAREQIEKSGMQVEDTTTVTKKTGVFDAS